MSHGKDPLVYIILIPLDAEIALEGGETRSMSIAQVGMSDTSRARKRMGEHTRAWRSVTGNEPKLVSTDIAFCYKTLTGTESEMSDVVGTIPLSSDSTVDVEAYVRELIGSKLRTSHVKGVVQEVQHTSRSELRVVHASEVEILRIFFKETWKMKKPAKLSEFVEHMSAYRRVTFPGIRLTPIAKGKTLTDVAATSLCERIVETRTFAEALNELAPKKPVVASAETPEHAAHTPAAAQNVVPETHVDASALAAALSAALGKKVDAETLAELLGVTLEEHVVDVHKMTAKLTAAFKGPKANETGVDVGGQTKVDKDTFDADALSDALASMVITLGE